MFFCNVKNVSNVENWLIELFQNKELTMFWNKSISRIKSTTNKIQYKLFSIEFKLKCIKNALNEWIQTKPNQNKKCKLKLEPIEQLKWTKFNV